MKIAINATVLTDNQLCGIGYSLFHLLDALLRYDAVNIYHLIAGKPIVHYPHSANCHVYSMRERGLSYVGISRGIKALDCDVAWIPGEVVPLGTSVPTMITAYDLFPLTCTTEMRQEISWKNKLHFFLASKIHFKRACRILAISEDTKKDIIEHCHVSADKIRVTPLGVNRKQFYPCTRDVITPVLNKYGIERPYFINTSSVWWGRKNLIRLIEAFAQLDARSGIDCCLVITGKKGSSYQAMQQLIHRRSLGKKILLLEYIAREDVPFLLSGALGLVFPSLHEGFGLPVLEAMSCGCPVITSNVSALPEVGGDAVYYVDPCDVEAIAHAMSTVYQDTAMRKKMSEQGIERAGCFTWEKTAQLTLKTFGECL